MINAIDGRHSIERIFQMCGPGSILEAGCGSGVMVESLLARGYDAYGVAGNHEQVDQASRSFPERFSTGTIQSVPFPDQSFDTVFSTHMDFGEEADVVSAFTECCRITRRCAIFFVPADHERNRNWWEQKAFKAGFRRHPKFFSITSYDALEDESGEILLFLEKIPAECLVQYPLESLLAERELHMDMLRESGRRSDAHLIRYSYFRPLISPGDTVVDVACGLGYGSGVLWDGTLAARIVGIDNSASAVRYARDNYAPFRSGLDFVVADADKIGFLDSGSVDIVFSFETVEHVEHPDAFMAEVQRILKPNGRFVCSVPNLWVDETGRDIGTYHLHSFGYLDILQLCRKYFTVAQVICQNAGGGYKYPECGRSIRELDPAQDHSNVDAEWWLMVGVKCASVPEETVVAIPQVAKGIPFAKKLSSLAGRILSGLRKRR